MEDLNRTIIKYPNTNDNDFQKKIATIFKQYRIKEKKTIHERYLFSN